MICHNLLDNYEIKNTVQQPRISHTCLYKLNYVAVNGNYGIVEFVIRTFRNGAGKSLSSSTILLNIYHFVGFTLVSWCVCSCFVWFIYLHKSFCFHFFFIFFIFSSLYHNVSKREYRNREDFHFFLTDKSRFEYEKRVFYNTVSFLLWCICLYQPKIEKID